MSNTTEGKSKKYALEDHSWGEAIGISKALVMIANELARLNDNLETVRFKKKPHQEQL